MGKIVCAICHKAHKARRHNFPRTLAETREVDHPEDAGKEVKRKIQKLFIIGHVCVGCDRSWKIRGFMKKHNIKPDKTGRNKISDMIRDKLKEIGMRGIRLPTMEGKPRGRG